MTSEEMKQHGTNTYITRQDAINKLSNELCKQVINILDRNLRSCLNCEKFDESNELCNAFNARPPARVIAKACDGWGYAEVPF